MEKTKRVFTGAPWEKAVSYCRAIQKNNFVAVSGTTSNVNGIVHALADPYAQTLKCLDILEAALKFAYNNLSAA